MFTVLRIGNVSNIPSTSLLYNIKNEKVNAFGFDIGF